MFFRRFLRARRFDVNAAFQQFKDTEDWRKENNIEALYENIDVESYEEARRVVCALSFISQLHDNPDEHRQANDCNSIPNGPAAATAAVSPSTSTSSST